MEPVDVRAEAAALEQRRARRVAMLRALVARVPVGQQLAGAGLATAGVWIQFGTGIALMLAGVALVAVGALREAGRI